tara:strand:- start:591 stop:839 length:249 start_codon:yes stop_codon:yes gene_type:complete
MEDITYLIVAIIILDFLLLVLIKEQKINKTNLIISYTVILTHLVILIGICFLNQMNEYIIIAVSVFAIYLLAKIIIISKRIK